MAFVVCYSWSPPDDHTRHGAIYLDQRFYELIYDRCRSESGQRCLDKRSALHVAAPFGENGVRPENTADQETLPAPRVRQIPAFF